MFFKEKAGFSKECLGYLRYVLNDHFVLFLLCPAGAFLAYQYSQLLQHFPEIIGRSFVCRNYLCFTFALGGIATYMEAPDKLFLLVGEEEIKLHLKLSNWHFPSLLALCPDPFLAVYFAPFIFGNGLWLCLSSLILCCFCLG